MRQGKPDPEIEKQKRQQSDDFNEQMNNMKKKAEEFAKGNRFKDAKFDAETLKKQAQQAFERAKKTDTEAAKKKAQDFF